MKWQRKIITPGKLNKISDSLDIDLIYQRIAYTIGCNKRQLTKYIYEKDVENILASILYNRNISSDCIKSVLNNIAESITDPHSIINIDSAAEIIKKYLDNKDAVIFIYADYDCDGVMSGYILYTILKGLGKCNVYVYFPERRDDYGLSENFCRKVIEMNNDNTLVITVDNGITKKEEINLLKKHNIEAVVTDHHPSIKNRTPDCLIVDPSNEENFQTEFTHLCSTEIAFKLGQVLKEMYNEYDMIKYTPYVALSILSDVMELNNENIALLQYGMEIINSKNCPPAIKALMNEANIDILSYKDILWTITPMINACGRLNSTKTIADLFLYQYDYDINEIAGEVNNINKKRKEITKDLVKTFDMFDFENDKACIIPLSDCPIGMVGILAGKAVSKYNKPSIVVNQVDGPIYKGSARSINNINIVELFKEMKELGLIIDYGGHPSACTCKFDINNLQMINSYLNSHRDDTLLNTSEGQEEILNIDYEINLDMINKYIFTLINLFPYDNKKFSPPIFEIKNLQIAGYKISQKNPDNIMFTFKNKSKTVDIWAWGFADKYLNELGCPEYISVAGEITKSFMNKNYTLNIIDIKKIS